MEGARQKVLDKLREQSIPCSQLFQEFLVEYELLSEYQLLQKNGPHTGVYIVPSAKSTLIWFGVIFVRSGYYSGAVFKFRIHIPHDFPHNEKPPFVAFDPPIFHPLVDQRTGELEFNKFIPKWKRHKDRIWHVVPWMRRIFLKIETENAANQEASDLYRTDLEQFRTKVNICKKLSQSILFEEAKTNDPNEIEFSELSDEAFSKLRAKMLRNGEKALNQPSKNSRSWMTKGSMQLFSK
ncbi:unnamed protein product [Oikopleura dioica]|uniref:UBC core domain-containing protein n=1 Tax=Oikopleura dioica TaxID=34765 RepID=E4WQV1_OIKDI|nr:unnamed protein product [Oikopleura dioica]